MIGRIFWKLGRYLPALQQILIKSIGQSLKGSPEKLLATLKQLFPPADYAVLAQPSRLKPFCDTTIEAMREGAKGTAYDVQRYSHEWDFSLDKVQMLLIVLHTKPVNSIELLEGVTQLVNG